MKKIYTLFLLIFLFHNFTIAQITITQSDFISFQPIGGSYWAAADTTSESVDIGQPGGNNNWDFSAYTPDMSWEIQVVLPSATPYADSFATADLANYFMLEESYAPGSSVTSETWGYFNTTDASHLGTISSSTVTDMSGTYNSLLVTRHFPPFIEYDFPIDFGKAWVKKDSSETLTLTDGAPPSVSVTVTTYDVQIDAWGTMTMPSGKVVDALRSREVETTTSYFFGIPLGNSVSVTYYFMGKNGESFSVTTESENPPTSGTVTGSIAWSNDQVTSVETVNNIPTKFELKQNYPNPFNPSTTIEYAINTPGFVSLKLYDILGNEIQSLVSKEQNAGVYKYTLDGSNLSSGNYFIRLVSGNNVETKKIVLLK